VTVAAALAAYAVCVGVLGPRLLGRADWTERAPRLGILTYLAAAWSVVAACGLAGLTLTVHATALGGGLSRLIGACVLRLRAEYATPGGGPVAWSGLTLTAAVAAWTAVTAVTHLRAVRGQAVRTAQAVRLVGRPEPDLGAVLVEHLQPAVYCVAGPHATVVMTTGALQALDPGQVDAVLAHERAHLACHHHRFLAIARLALVPLLLALAPAVVALALGRVPPA
jgi:Zn-dependent protease with chaperone function